MHRRKKCLLQPCLKNSTCTRDSLGYKCTCLNELYYGENCQYVKNNFLKAKLSEWGKLSYCRIGSESNKCIQNGNDYKSECDDGYSGIHCEKCYYHIKILVLVKVHIKSHW